jgi:bifunctional UDP-N-acetylglucosamine pyrophosphorylase / glucosamine-1-phosphate N-acetyltransferase
MVLHVIEALSEVSVDRTVVVVGHGAQAVEKRLVDDAPSWANVSFAEQAEQRGTGHATMIGLDALDSFDDVLVVPDDIETVVVLPGDTPLLTSHSIAELVDRHQQSGWAATVLTAIAPDPTGYGRVVRARDGRVMRIVEQRDATPDEHAIDEINTGILAFRRNLLGPALRRTSPDNAQAEYYLTDVVQVLAGMGHQVGTVVASFDETAGVNDRAQLAAAEQVLRRRINRHWMLEGVTLVDPDHTYLDVTVRLGRDVTVHPGSILAGNTVVGDGCEIGPHTHLVDCVVEDGATVSHSVARSSRIGADAVVGPFASLPPGISVTSDRPVPPFYTGPLD